MTAADTVTVAIAGLSGAIVVAVVLEAWSQWEARQRQRDRDRVAMRRTIDRTGGPRP